MDCETCKEKRKVSVQTPKKVWKIIAELMETLQVINPRLYAGVIKKLKAQRKRGQHPLNGAVLFYLRNGISFCWVYSFCPV